MKCLKKWVAKMSQKYGRGTVRTETTLVWLHCLFPQTNICRASVPPDIAHHEVHKVIQPWRSQDDGIPPCKKTGFCCLHLQVLGCKLGRSGQKKWSKICIAQLPSFAKVWDFPQCMFFEVVPIVLFCPPSLYSDHKASSHSSFVCFVWWNLVPSTTGRGRQSKLCCSFNNANGSILKLHACKTTASVNRNCLGVVGSCYNSGQTY